MKNKICYQKFSNAALKVWQHPFDYCNSIFDLVIIAPTLALLFLLPAGCEKEKTVQSRANNQGGVNAQTTERVMPVSVVSVPTQDISLYIETTGTLHPDNEVVVGAEIEGKIDAINLEEGDQIKKDDRVAKIEDTNLALKLKETDANLRFSRSELTRKSKLFTDGLLTQQQFDEAKTRFDLAQVSYGLAKESLRKTKITAPISGYIKEKIVSAGEYVKVGAPLVKIVKLDPLRLKASIPEALAGRLSLGQRVELEVKAFPGEKFSGDVAIINPNVDEASRSLMFEARIPNRNGRLKPGFFANLRLITGTKRNAVVVSEGAIITRENEDIVFVVKDGIANKRIIEPGERLDGKIEVIRGLDKDEKVVVVGNHDLMDKTKVRVIKEE